MENLNEIKKRKLNYLLFPLEVIRGLPKTKNCKMIDIGANNPSTKDFLPEHVIYHSLDLSEGHTFTHNLDEFPFNIPDNSYDIVMCLETLEHTMYPHKVMKELIRIAKPNALFLLSLPNDYNIIMRLYYLLGIKKSTSPPFTVVEEHQHIHTLRKKDIIKFYENYLNIEKIKYSFCSNKYISQCGFVLGFLTWIFNTLAPIFPSLFSRNIGVSGHVKTK